MSLATEMVFGSGGNTPFQFSTDEQKTKLKWIDGKPIYCKSFTFTTSKTTSNYANVSNLNIDKVINLEGSCIVANDFTLPINSYDGTYKAFIFYSQQNGTIRGSASSEMSCICTLYYTKTTD